MKDEQRIRTLLLVPFCEAVFKRIKKVRLTDAYANEESTQVGVLNVLGEVPPK